MAVGKEAAKRGIKVFVEISTAQIYDAGKKPSAEDGKLKPWTLVAKSKLKAEEELKKLAGYIDKSTLLKLHVQSFKLVLTLIFYLVLT